MIYLVRHGQTNWNAAGRPQGREDVPLNLEGIKEAMGRQDVFSGHRLKVFTSPLTRAKASAELITKKADVEFLETDERLIEYDFGSRDRPPEDIDQFLLRIVEALKDYGNYDGNVVVVSHGAVIGDLIRLFLPEERRDEILPLYNLSVTAIDYNGEAFSLVGVNIDDTTLEKILTEHD